MDAPVCIIDIDFTVIDITEDQKDVTIKVTIVMDKSTTGTITNVHEVTIVTGKPTSATTIDAHVYIGPMAIAI